MSTPRGDHPLQASQVTSNANSKLIRISLIIGDVTLSSVYRMNKILEIAEEYDKGTRGHPARKVRR